jgi:sugar lactone lactonase YvrE
MKKFAFILSLSLLLLASCNTSARRPDKHAVNGPLKQFTLTEIWRTDTILLVPESVIFDKTRNVLYVSDLNQEPRKKDGNGFISKLSTDGNIIDLHWIDGLSSPKGMAIVKDTLYAADVDELVVMDINKGQIIRKVTIAGIKMINDITSDSDGNLYISDSDANKIYRYSNGKLSEWLTEGLNAPNGLLIDGERLLLASMGTMDFSSIDLKTKVKTVLTEAISKGDGIAFTGIAGYYLVTDWNGEIFLINPDNTKVSLLNTIDKKINSADIEFIPGLKLLLVPTFNNNSVVAYRLSEL